MEHFFLCKGDLSTESGNADPIPCIHFFICGLLCYFCKNKLKYVVVSVISNYYESTNRRKLAETITGRVRKPYFEHLVGFVKEEYARYTVFPPGSRIFHAYNTCHFEKVKVVILGQDPYHEPGQYYGLCFSVMDGVPFPPSLVNIFKEIQNDLGKPIPCSGRLERWADQGVLLINAILTVRHIRPVRIREKAGRVYGCRDPATE